MFGFVVANTATLDSSQLEVYKSYYCGLCHALREHYGGFGRMTLTYDMTFLAMLLDSVYNLQPESGNARCVPHPFKRHSYYSGENLDYAAGMNILLAYYNRMDDWNDDHNVFSAAQARLLKNAYLSVRDAWPKRCFVVEQRLEQLSEIEKINVLNPDIPSNCFGALMGELFVRDDSHGQALWAFGKALGRFIYIMDACIDLKRDIRAESYNPLVTFDSQSFYPMLSVLMAECTTAFEQLGVIKNRAILENILYSGVWTQYAVKFGTPANKGGDGDE